MSAKMKERGFTLIELLVVIAIIGLLSAVVLASLNSARSKGADAAVKDQLKNTQAQAEIVYDNTTPNKYDGVCTDTSIQAQVNAAANAGGATAPTWATHNSDAATASKAVCHDSASAYAVQVPLKATANTSWCVDSTGAAKLENNTWMAANATVCP